MQPSQWALPAFPLIFPPGLALRAYPFYQTHTEELLLPGIQWSVTQTHLVPPNRLEPARAHPGTNNYLHIPCFSCTFAWTPPSSSGKAGYGGSIRPQQLGV